MPRDDAETRRGRRKQIRRLREAGMSMRAIARSLGLSLSTVQWYLTEKPTEKSRSEPTEKSRSEPDQPENVVQLRRKAL